MNRFLSLVLLGLLSACAIPRAIEQTAAPVEVGIIAINDFHGALEPPKASIGASDGNGGMVAVPAGGAAWLASAVDSLKAEHPNNVVVAAGDLTSASQLASSLHLDEPAVGVMNRIGLEFNAVGNHEFDRGWKELQRLQDGGCEKYTRLQPCQLEQFKGAGYRYLAASTYKPDGSTLFPATGMKTFGSGAGKVTVGFIGLSLREVPTLVAPEQIRGLTFGDEAEAINREVPRLKAAGADAIVVLIHQGGKTTGESDPNGCEGLNGGILPILTRIDPRVDVVVSGHTHWAYVCNYGEIDPSRPILLTSANVYGKAVTDITLTIDPASHRVLAKQAHNVIVQSQAYSSGRGAVANTALYPAFQPRADVSAYVARYVHNAQAQVSRPVGHLSGPASKSANEGMTGGSLGSLIADAQLAASREAGAQIAFTNPFGIRAPIDPGPDGEVTFGQVYAVQPFNNTLVTMTLTGAQVREVIEDGLSRAKVQQVLAPSANVRFAYDLRRPAGERLLSLTVDGKPVDPQADYRVTVNNFLAEGGDGFATFTKGRDVRKGMVDSDAFQQWIGAVPVRQVPHEPRAIEHRN
ncbi:bifunctional metallophosphatase/5'-nucleotidase [Novosphingobium mathurense]|uniref:5'-nucleotidase n=1 Tax=Novosphingobium mathurense TaxID=428990 RepID=A0A1U6HGD4_9SPHN|nr:bifunctional metallophosphatase/5'-nucleotidase [Novosphingobium mathurense]SLJ94799.1 5'-nucleotidase [Novosphingobium mathurense]